MNLSVCAARCRVVAASMMLFSPGVFAAPVLSGDVTRDGLLDITDVVTLVNLLASPELVTGMDLIIADANQDGPLDSADAAHVARVILGLESAKPIIGEGNARLVSAASFWALEPPSSLVREENARQLGTPAFWHVAPAPTQVEGSNAILRANTSFEYEE